MEILQHSNVITLVVRETARWVTEIEGDAVYQSQWVPQGNKIAIRNGLSLTGNYPPPLPIFPIAGEAWSKRRQVGNTQIFIQLFNETGGDVNKIDCDFFSLLHSSSSGGFPGIRGGGRGGGGVLLRNAIAPSPNRPFNHRRRYFDILTALLIANDFSTWPAAREGCRIKWILDFPRLSPSRGIITWGWIYSASKNDWIVGRSIYTFWISVIF